MQKYALEAKPPFLKGSAFHAQQCAEKSLKAYLALIGHRVPKTHDLRALADLALKHCSDLTDGLNSIENLVKYVTASRYPTDLVFTDTHVSDAIRIAELAYKTLYAQYAKSPCS